MQNTFLRVATSTTASVLVSIGLLFVPAFASAATLNVGPSATYHTIQAAINAASAGDTIYVYPGNYDETAPDSTLTVADGGGTYQFGLFLPANKAGLSIIGVDAAGTPITSYAGIQAHITTNSTANFGPDGVFVEGANDTIQALDIGANNGGANKTIEVVADNFTLKYSEISEPTGGDLYINSFSGALNTVNKYTVTGNLFALGATLDIANGAGASTPATDRQITGNTFSGAPADYPYALISFDGAGGQAWYVNPVGGAVITGNNFTSGGNGTKYIRTRGVVSDPSQFNWKSYWTGNTFDNSAITLSDASGSYTVRPYATGVYTNVQEIGTSIQNELGHAQTGDTVLVGAGTYNGSITIDKDNIKLIGASEAAVTINENAVDTFGYGFTVDHAAGASISNMSFVVPVASPIGFAFHAYHADGLTLQNLSFTGPGKTSTRIGGVDINTTNNVTETNVSASNFYKNGFSFTSQYVAADAPADGIALSGITATNNGWSGVAFYTVGNDHSPVSIGGSHSFAAVSLQGSNTISNNTRGIQVEGTSDAAQGTGTTPVNTVTTNGTTLDLSHVAFDGNATDIVNYQTAPVNAIGTTFGGMTGDNMTATQQGVQDGKIFDQLDLASLGLVHYHNPAVGTLDITKYACPAGTTVVRSVNGVDKTVPAGCVPEAGATFGYVHGTQTDANDPYPELSASLTAAGTTDATGDLTVTNLLSAGRYLVVETDGNNQKLPASSVLGLYCTGDGDPSDNNDNQELTFVPANGTVHCVAYDQMALTAPTNLLPTNGTYTSNRDFVNTWTPVPGAAKYQYETSNVLNGSDLGPIIWSDETSTFNYVITPTLITRHNGGTPEGDYYWHVRAVDALGNVGPWSVISKVTVDSIAPTVPTLLTPINAATVPTNDFMFTWSASTDASPVTYEFQSSLNPASADGVLTTGIWDSISSGMTLTDPSIHSTGAPNGIWNWQVRAIDAAGNKSAWSPIWTVTLNTKVATVAANPIGLTTTTLNGADGQTDADNTSFWWGTTPITGTLIAGTDPGSSEFPVVGWNHDNGLGPIAAKGSFNEPLTGLIPNTKYYFVAWSKINGTWYPGQVLSFQTNDGSLPSVTTNVANPFDTNSATISGTNGSVAADNTSFWWGTTPITGTLIAGTDPGSSEFPASGWTHDSGLGIAAAGGSFNESLSGLTPGTAYYYVAWIESNGTWYPGAVQSFTTALVDPAPATPGAVTGTVDPLDSTSATVHGINGSVDAVDTSFWLGTTSAGPFTSSDTPESELPSGWYGIDSLAQTATSPFSHTYTGLAPSTDYYYVAWSKIGTTWYPGEVKSFKTLVTPAVPAPKVTDRNVTTGKDKTVTITLTSDDAAANYSIVANPSHGTLSGTGATETYTPAAGYTGADSFTFKANNGSDSNVATISITVQAPPILSVNPANPAKLAVSNSAIYSDNGAIVTGPAGDTMLGIVTSVDGVATTTPFIDLKTPGTHTILYAATDAFGNQGTATRTVIVSDAPVITLTGDSTINLATGDTYTEYGATATDLADGTDVVTLSGTVDTSTAGTYTVTYNAVDSVGNNAVPVTRTIVVSAPVVTPTIESFGGNGPIMGTFTGVSGDTTGQGGFGSIAGNTGPLPGGTGGSVLGASTFNFKTNMRVGSRLAPDVTELQKVLVAAGYLKLTAPTGYFGTSTYAAVKLYQAAHNVPATGFVGPLTRAVLNLGTTPTKVD